MSFNAEDCRVLSLTDLLKSSRKVTNILKLVPEEAKNLEANFLYKRGRALLKHFCVSVPFHAYLKNYRFATASATMLQQQSSIPTVVQFS